MHDMVAKGVLLDIEGTTSSISFVYDEMFPYVRLNLEHYLAEHWQSSSLRDCLPLLAADIGQKDVDSWLTGGEAADQLAVATAVIGLMDADVKATGLKQLQGMIWKAGFESGQLVAHLFEDVAPAIGQWRTNGLDVRIYSSGSVAAQRLFFGHTIAGNLLGQFSGHYDTTTGSKREAGSYTKIAAEFGLQPNEVVFVSDVLAELEAAEEAGLQAVLSIRPGNQAVDSGHSFKTVSSFADMTIQSGD